jgi:branched-chain amino acid transport system substrate-binding protein
LSFIKPRFPDRTQGLLDKYKAEHPECQSSRDVISPTGTVHAYELIRILAVAAEQAGSSDRTKIRDALENLNEFSGVMKDYNPPFSRSNHDALTAEDFVLARYGIEGGIEPVSQSTE